MKYLIVANWKMNLGIKESAALAEEIRDNLPDKNEAEVVLCPSFVALTVVADVIRGTEIALGAQDVFWEDRGAYTGEVSSRTLKEIGCKYVIVGHSERRGYLKESDEVVHKKVKQVINEGLTPIICIGESFNERQEGQKDYIVMTQVTRALSGIDIVGDHKVAIAYEPVWVIGSGQAVEPEEAENTHRVIRQTLIDIYPTATVNNNFKIIYGGSVDSYNVVDFLKQDTVQGVLVGSASLKAKEFINIICHTT